MVSIELDFYNIRIFCLILKFFAYEMGSLGILHKFFRESRGLKIKPKVDPTP